MTILVLVIAGFILGALPLSYWLGRVVLHVDVRDYGADHNPGAGNAWRAGGWALGATAAALDVGKAAVVVVLARHVGVMGWALVPVALAPLLGHAWSPFLGFHGGKGVAATFGIWLGLLGPLGALGLAVCFGVVYAVQSTDAWTNLIGFGLFLAVLLAAGAPAWIDATALANLLVLAWTNRHELGTPPAGRTSLSRLLGREQ